MIFPAVKLFLVHSRSRRRPVELFAVCCCYRLTLSFRTWIVSSFCVCVRRS